MKLSEYVKQMADLLEREGDMACIYRKDDEGNAYYKVEGAGYTTLTYVDQMKNDYEVEALCCDEIPFLLENEYIQSEDELVKVCVING